MNYKIDTSAQQDGIINGDKLVTGDIARIVADGSSYNGHWVVKSSTYVTSLTNPRFMWSDGYFGLSVVRLKPGEIIKLTGIVS